MRIVSYNILDGGEGRADPVAEVILAGRPDIVGIVEADNDAVLERLSLRLEMDYIVARGGRHAVALFSRWPILQSVDHGALKKGFTGSLLEALVCDPHGVHWPIGVVHLTAKATEERETKREAEIAVVLDTFAPHRDVRRPHVIMGDFNANAPSQVIDPSLCNPATRDAWKLNGKQVPRRVIQRILDAGYMDSLHAAHASKADVAYTFTTQYPGQRLDYCFTYGVEKHQHVDAWVEKDRLAQYASDHFPVGVELRVTAS